MAPKKKRPGERRRNAKRRRKKKDPTKFVRPVDWARQELHGVKAWLGRLKGPEGPSFPEGWRRGQIRHYEKRARMIRAEIKASAAEAEAAKGEDGDGPKAA